MDKYLVNTVCTSVYLEQNYAEGKAHRMSRKDPMYQCIAGTI